MRMADVMAKAGRPSHFCSIVSSHLLDVVNISNSLKAYQWSPKAAGVQLQTE